MAFIRIICLLLIGLSAKAQTFSEWFDQKNTKKKYLIEQIAAIQALRGEIKAGYNVAHNGLSTIGNYNTSEYELHDAYYKSLKSASPAVKNNPQIAEIIGYQTDINKRLNQLPSDAYYDKVKSTVLKDCDAQLTQLQKVIANGQTQMTDADRLKAINTIHTNMLGNYRFSYAFVSQALLLQQDKSRQQKEVLTLTNVYEKH